MVSSTELAYIREKATNEAIAYTQTFHPTFKAATGTKLSKLYFCASDQDGFPLNFDDIWQLVGYRRKDHAKSNLVSRKLGLKESIDYKVTSTIKGKGSKQWGGHNREDIWLTARGFSQFALAAQTDEGVALRDFLLYLTSQVKVLMINLQAGHVRIVPGGETDSDRLKACASQQNLKGVLDCIDFTTGQTYFRVNEETKRIVTGTATGQDLELNEAQLAAANLGEMFSAENIAKEYESGGIRNDSDVIESHRKTFRSLFTPETLKDMREKHLVMSKRKRKHLKDKDSTSTKDKKQKSMTQYFGSRV